MAKLVGNITANIIAYVGLQLLNTGQSDIQINTLHNTHFFLADCHSFVLDFSDNHILVEKSFHKLGNIVINQNNIKIIQENNFHTIGSTHMNNVEALSRRENIIIDIQRDNIIIYGLNLSLVSDAEAHKIIGKSGNTHGARIVNTQARNDIINNVIIFFI